MAGLISVAEALAKVLAPLSVLPPETLALDRAFGRVLAEAPAARRTQPPFDMSAMDGWALRQADLGGPITPIGEAAAGGAFTGVLGPGQAVRIFTGARVPDGADTIVLQEDADLVDGRLQVREAPPPGKHVRRQGLDFRVGDQPLVAGRRLSPRDIALLAAMDVPWIAVRRRPRVAILATGDELARPGEPLGPDQIVASNHLGVAGLVLAAGGEVIDLGIARDEADHLRHMAEGARGADYLVTIGGASVGDRDLVGRVLGQAGLVLDFHKIAMRPGKPLMSGAINGTPFLGLPGNPVSAMVCGLLFLAPALKALMGLPPRVTTARARAGAALGPNDKRQDYVRAALTRDDDGTFVATPFPIQDSSMLTVLADAGCLIQRPPHDPAIAPGDWLTVLPFDPD